MLYGKATNVPPYVAMIRSSYRISALRELRAWSYRTVSYDAICVISGMIPIDLVRVLTILDVNCKLPLGSFQQ